MPIITTHDITLYGETDRYRIILRPLCDAYLPLLYKWNADPEVLYWTEGGEDIERSYDQDTVHEIYGGVSRQGHCFLVEVDGAPVGECWLQRMNLEKVSSMYPGLDVRRIDMAIGEKECWGRGIGTAFVGMLVEFAFTVENVDVLHCFAEDYNVRSQRVWLKNGFRLVKTEELPQPQKGKLQYHFALTRAEFNKSRVSSPQGTASCGSR
ncbi:MAG: GNAT family N-acetyltransferase [Anaerolineae bacterium]|nr:GNAT family N-acetyltransferase [Anaerolineae bacterium]